MATIRRKKPESFAILSSPGPWPQVLINWLATLAVIIVFGLIMLFSASYTTGYLRMGDSFYYIKSQVFCLGLGLAVMLLFSRIDHRFLRRMVGPGYVVCIVMLIAVLFSAPLNPTSIPRQTLRRLLRRSAPTTPQPVRLPARP